MKNNFYKSFLLTFVILFIVIPFLIFLNVKGIFTSYAPVSVMIIIFSLVPFIYIFEKKKIKVRDVVLISSLSALAVLGRIVFFMFPQIKASTAIVIISGICLGSEAGFFIGLVSMFVSNFFFSQGTWTIWQMFALAMLGFISGIIFKSKKEYSRLYISSLGGILTFIIYSGIMNLSSVIYSTGQISFSSVISICLIALPFDIVHCISTMVFLWYLYLPFLEKITRIKEKYGIIYHR